MKPHARDEWLREIGLGLAVLNLLFGVPLSLYLIFVTAYSWIGAVFLLFVIMLPMAFWILRSLSNGEKIPKAVVIYLSLMFLQMSCAVWMLAGYANRSSSFSYLLCGLFLMFMIARKVVWRIHKRNS